MELRFLKEATSSIQVVVTELSGFGTTILVNVINLGGEVGSVCSEGPWVFVGMPNVVKVWNTESGAEYSLNGPVGQVNALTAVKDLLFVGVEDGVILAWKGTNETNVTFQVASPIWLSLSFVNCSFQYMCFLAFIEVVFLLINLIVIYNVYITLIAVSLINYEQSLL
ncbi:zinc finger CCCH domain-containing protein 48-like isoform X2 [Fagus crenata]